jgi:hypothetical protein
MSLTWKGTAKCSSYHLGGCDETCEVTFTLEAQRKITVKAPEGWMVFTRGFYDSQRDVNEVDVGGDDYQVRCPEHKERDY